MHLGTSGLCVLQTARAATGGQKGSHLPIPRPTSPGWCPAHLPCVPSTHHSLPHSHPPQPALPTPRRVSPHYHTSLHLLHLPCHLLWVCDPLPVAQPTCRFLTAPSVLSSPTRSWPGSLSGLTHPPHCLAVSPWPGSTGKQLPPTLSGRSGMSCSVAHS